MSLEVFIHGCETWHGVWSILDFSRARRSPQKKLSSTVYFHDRSSRNGSTIPSAPQQRLRIGVTFATWGRGAIGDMSAHLVLATQCLHRGRTKIRPERRACSFCQAGKSTVKCLRCGSIVHTWGIYQMWYASPRLVAVTRSCVSDESPDVLS